MDTINVRDFLRNFKKYFPLPEHGIRVKRKGGDFMVIKIPEEQSLQQENLPQDIEKSKVEPEANISPQISSPKKGFCQGHFEKGIEYELKQVTYEDERGEPVYTRQLCWECLEKIKTYQRYHGGTIKVDGVNI
jgi:hypothetical protein